MRHKIQRNTFLIQSNEGLWRLTYIDTDYSPEESLPTGEIAGEVVRQWGERGRRTTREKSAAAQFLNIGVSAFLEDSVQQRHLRLDKKTRTMLSAISTYDSKEEPDEIRWLIEQRHKCLFGQD